MRNGPALTLEERDYLLLDERISCGSPRPEIDQLLVRFSFRGGLRVSEIASLTTDAVLDARGNLSDEIRVTVSKGRRGRTVVMHPEIRNSLREFFWHHPEARWFAISPRDGRQMSRAALGMYFKRLYDELGFVGCSSHSGRATCITELARRAGEFGCSLHDVMQFAGHKHLASTAKYLRPAEGARDLIHAIGRGPGPQSIQHQGRKHDGSQGRRRKNRSAGPSTIRQGLQHEAWIAEQFTRTRV